MRNNWVLIAMGRAQKKLDGLRIRYRLYHSLCHRNIVQSIWLAIRH